MIHYTPLLSACFNFAPSALFVHVSFHCLQSVVCRQLPVHSIISEKDFISFSHRSAMPRICLVENLNVYMKFSSLFRHSDSYLEDVVESGGWSEILNTIIFFFIFRLLNFPFFKFQWDVTCPLGSWTTFRCIEYSGKLGRYFKLPEHNLRLLCTSTPLSYYNCFCVY